MNQQIQRLQKDIENFPKTQDERDKFVEKMSISFLHIFVGNLRFQHLKMRFKSLLPCFVSGAEEGVTEHAGCKKMFNRV